MRYIIPQLILIFLHAIQVGITIARSQKEEPSLDAPGMRLVKYGQLALIHAFLWWGGWYEPLLARLAS